MSEHIDLAAIKARCEAATPGPWRNFGDWMIHTELDVEKRGIPGDKLVDTVRKENAEFIAHAREDVPKLIEENERLRDKIGQLTYDSQCEAERLNRLFLSEHDIAGALQEKADRLEAENERLHKTIRQIEAYCNGTLDQGGWEQYIEGVCTAKWRVYKMLPALPKEI
jgi:hypothetical protein